MRVVAITGEIGSGKSTVGRFLVENGATVIDTDEISHQIDQKTPAQRKELAKKVFQDNNERARLEQNLWPRIKKVLDEKLLQARAQNIPLVFVQIPRLFETDWLADFDEILLITADETLRRQRLQSRGLSPAEIELRLKIPFDPKNTAISAKIPLTKLENNGNIRLLKQATQKFLFDLEK